MKRISISAILILFISHAFASAVFQTVTLPNPQSDKIVVKMMFRNGSMSDPKGMEGITQLTSSLMLDGGTGKFSASDIKSMTYPWAARWYSTVDKEVTVFTFEFHKDHAEQMLSIMTGLVVAPAFSESDYKRIKSNQENYINEVIRSSSDEELSKYALESFLFRDTRYAHPIGGTSQGLTNVSLEEVVRYHKASFTTRNLMLGIAGAYTDPYLLKLQEAMMKLPDANPSTLQPVVARNPKGLQVEIITKQNTLGSAIFAGFPLEITRSQDEFAALMVANSWLVEHLKRYSRLYQKIREQRGLCYSIFAQSAAYEDTGQITIYAGTSAEEIGDLTQITMDELKRAADDMSDAEVARARVAVRRRHGPRSLATGTARQQARRSTRAATRRTSCWRARGSACSSRSRP